MGFCRTRGDAQSSPVPLQGVGLCRDPEPGDSGSEVSLGHYLRSFIVQGRKWTETQIFHKKPPNFKGLQRIHYFKAGSPLQTLGRADLRQVDALPHAKMSPPCCQWGCAWGPLPPDKHKSSPSSLTCPGLPSGISEGVTLVSLFHCFSVVSEQLPWALSNASHKPSR